MRIKLSVAFMRRRKFLLSALALFGTIHFASYLFVYQKGGSLSSTLVVADHDRFLQQEGGPIFENSGRVERGDIGSGKASSSSSTASSVLIKSAPRPPNWVAEDMMSGGAKDEINLERQKIPPQSQQNSSPAAGKKAAIEPDAGSSLLPMQQNPWIDSGSASSSGGDPLSAFEFSRQKVGECHFRQFANNSVFGKPDFIQEYKTFKACSAKLKNLEEWTQTKISAEVGPKSELILRTDFRFDLNAAADQVCSMEDPPKMFYFVFSAEGNFAERNSVRKTWGDKTRLKKVGHRLVFFLGRGDNAEAREKLGEEARLHRDIVQSEVEEGEPNFAHRQTASMLCWVYKHCELARFVVKTTDTTFVNVRRFQLFQEQEMHSANRLYGTMLKGMQPDRDPAHAHYVSEEDWPWQFFPPFLAGPSYVISGDVVPRLLVAVKFTPPFPLEQVFFTGLATLTNRIMRIGVASFFEDKMPNGEEGDECAFARHGAIEGVRTREEMERVWRDVDRMQEVRNVTCTVKPSCLAKIDGKCMVFTDKAKKKNKDKKKNAVMAKSLRK